MVVGLDYGYSLFISHFWEKGKHVLHQRKILLNLLCRDNYEKFLVAGTRCSNPRKQTSPDKSWSPRTDWNSAPRTYRLLIGELYLGRFFPRIGDLTAGTNRFRLEVFNLTNPIWFIVSSWHFIAVQMRFAFLQDCSEVVFRLLMLIHCRTESTACFFFILPLKSNKIGCCCLIYIHQDL